MELYNKFSMEMILPNGELFKYETDRIERLQIMNECFDYLNKTIIEPKYTKKDLIDFFNYVYSFKCETDRNECLQIMNACFDRLNTIIIEPKYTKKDLIYFFEYIYDEFSDSIIKGLFDINYENEFLGEDDNIKDKELVFDFETENPEVTFINRNI